MSTHNTTDTLASLTAELTQFCNQHGLPQQCADELQREYTLTPEQRAWLTAFCARWDAVVDREQSAARAFVHRIRQLLIGHHNGEQ
jgi:hypothetical protein